MKCETFNKIGSYCNVALDNIKQGIRHVHIKEAGVFGFIAMVLGGTPPIGFVVSDGFR